MKKYHVLLHEICGGQVYVEAESESEASRIAMQSPEVDWDDDTSHCYVFAVVEVSEEDYQEHR